MTEITETALTNIPEMVVTLPSPDHDLIRAVSTFAEAAGKLVVSDVASRDGAAVQLREVATLAGLLDKNRKERTTVLDRKKTEIMDTYRPAEALLASARASLQSRIQAFEREQARLRAEEQARLEREAERERARLARQAERAAGKGDMAKAIELDTRAATTAAPVAPSVPKVGGVSTRKVWKFEIVNAALIPPKYLMPDEKMIAGVVKAMGSATDIPGVRVWSEEEMAVRKL